jgi:hypothetical protein
MTSIASIARTTQNRSPSAKARSAKPETALAIVPTSKPQQTARHALMPSHNAAFIAHTLAGTPRRGLKAEPAQQARIHTTYARLQSGHLSLSHLPPGSLLDRLV